MTHQHVSKHTKTKKRKQGGVNRSQLFQWPPAFAVAHRGASNNAPENTISALKSAAELGAKSVECDLRLTADDQVIIFHDAFLGRTTNGRGIVSRHKLAQIRQLDAGSWFSQKYVGEKVPTLEEWLQCAYVLGISLNLELKVYSKRQAEVLIAQLLTALAQYPAVFSNRCIISSNYSYAIQRVAELTPSLSTALISDRKLSVKYITALRKQGVMALHQHSRVATKAYVGRVHANKMRFLAYTVNRKEQAVALSECVDGIFTDNHDLFSL